MKMRLRQQRVTGPIRIHTEAIRDNIKNNNNNNINRNARRSWILVLLGVSGLAGMNVYLSIHHDPASKSESETTTTTTPLLLSEPMFLAMETFSGGQSRSPASTSTSTSTLHGVDDGGDRAISTVGKSPGSLTPKNHTTDTNGGDNNDGNISRNENKHKNGSRKKTAKKAKGTTQTQTLTLTLTLARVETETGTDTAIAMDPIHTTNTANTGIVAAPDVFAPNNTKTKTKIQLLMSKQELDWIRKRTILFREEIISIRKVRSLYDKAFNDPLSRSGHPDHNYAMDSGNNSRAVVEKLYDAAKLRVLEMETEMETEKNRTNSRRGGSSRFRDPSEGPWLDFMVAGNPKCGTTTLMANLRRIAPMPVMDFCTGVTQTLRNAYLVWPNDPNCTAHVRDRLGPDPTRWLRGSKCPRFLSQNFLLGFASVLPKTKLIVGIRHPVTWFESFWSMGGKGGKGIGDLLSNTQLCPCPIDPVSGNRPKICPDVFPNERCYGECRCNAPLCLHRTRFHLPLAKLGKTPLTKEERSWLAAGDDDGGEHLVNARVPNPVFLYDQTQMMQTQTQMMQTQTQMMQTQTQMTNNNSSYWDDLAAFLGVSEVPNEDYYAAHGRSSQFGGTKSETTRNRKSLCVERLDYFRSRIMGYSYELAVWIQEYWLPVAADPQRPDVVVAGSIDEFWKLAETYKEDPCGRLVRRESDGIYVLKDEHEHQHETIQRDPVYGSMDVSLLPQCEMKEAR